MTILLGDYVEFVTVDNRTRNAIRGCIKLRGQARALAIRLSGNCRGILAGRHFTITPQIEPAEVNGKLPKLGDPQIGPTGIMNASRGGVEMEWFGQNGRTLVQLPRVKFQLVERAKERRSQAAPTDPIFHTVLTRPGASVNQGAVGLIRSITDEQLNEASGRPKSQYNEVMFGREDDWDQIAAGIGEVPIKSLVSPAVKAAESSRLSDREVTAALRDLLAQLARIGVSLEVCPHFQPRQSWQYIHDTILTHTIHPKVVEMGFVSFYITADQCDFCFGNAKPTRRRR